jgi:mono/diheme cytochrome c family protein
MQMLLLRWGGIALAVPLVLLLLVQAVPYGRDHSNPPVRQEPAWDSPETRALAVDACFDCHSNETDWPLYSNIAPASWLIQHDVDAGREKVNFSEWDRAQEEADELAEQVEENKMPPKYYRWFHSEARLSSAEREALVRGFQAMFGEGEAGEGGDEH